jgi:hypothetical protein
MDNVVTPEATPSAVIPEQNVHPTSGAGQQALNQDEGQQQKEVAKPPVVKEAPKAKETLRQSLEAAAKGISDEEAAAKAKEAKPETDKETTTSSKDDQSAKPVKADAGEPDKELERQRKSEVRDRPEPPARFLPLAKEHWRNVPNSVQAEVARMAADHEAEVTQYKEHKQFREEVKDFEDLAKAHNVTFKQALTNYVEIEKKFASNPSDGFRELLNNQKMHPAQAIGHILQAYGIKPEALAAHIGQDPSMYTPQARQQTQQQEVQKDPEIASLKEELQQMKMAQTAQQYIEPFKAAHPRYQELEPDIAFFLQSGKIPANMSPADKLAAAYDMAERINPSSNVEQLQQKRDFSESRVDEDLNGTKSVKSSPGSVLDNPESTKKMSLRETLLDEARRMKRA